VHVGGLGGTYGGNPVACAAALGAIETMVEQDLAGRARSIGQTMTTRLADIAEKHPAAGDVRGRGAMVAVELVGADGSTPDPGRAGAISAFCHAHGVVTLTCGTYGNVLRFLPPLVMPEHLLTEAFDVVAEAFDATR
jgi:4-aminobutyrate aminotransferase / (S)-3-amino-2-methylpropionate transaminase / 5-aminovalerate transaminase